MLAVKNRKKAKTKAASQLHGLASLENDAKEAKDDFVILLIKAEGDLFDLSKYTFQACHTKVSYIILHFLAIKVDAYCFSRFG